MFTNLRALVWLVIWIGLSFGAGAIGGIATGSGLVAWYPSLRKPDWTPPNWLFGPVWSLLYIMIGVAAWLIQRRRADHPTLANLALAAWGVQLALNTAWSLVFFGQRQIGVAFGVIVALWGAILVFVALASRVSRLATWLMLPYLAWVTFAAALNAAISRLNNGGS